MSHDFLNKVGSGDDDLLEFLKSIQPYSNNTLLLVISDHGHRYDAIRETVVGRVEARMPYLNVVVPRWFPSKYPKAYQNLRDNSGRLITPFDLFATMADILYDTVDKGPSPADVSKVPHYALSLFKPISPKRNCKDAHVPEEYCPCYQETALNPSEDKKVYQAAIVLLDYINDLLKNDRPPCALLHLAKIKDAFIYLPHQGTLQDVQVGNKIPKRGFYFSYRIVIETYPGGALLEGIVKHFLDNGKLSVEGDVDRNNAYGNSSYCVTKHVLKKYCYCTKVGTM